MVTFNEDKQEQRLRELRAQEQESLARMLADRHGISYIDLSTTSINTDALRLIEEGRARTAKMASFSMTGKNLEVAVQNPTTQSVQDEIAELNRLGYTTNLSLASEQSLERAWDRYSEVSHSARVEEGVFDIADQEIATFREAIGNTRDLERALQDALSGKSKYQTSEILELFISGALATEASDIHFEPKETAVSVRLRLDGVLQDLITITPKVYSLMLSRIKLLSGLKINIRGEAQDGRFSIKFKKTEIEIRTSVIPGAYGESVVLRILNPDAIAVELQALGMSETFLKLIDREIHRPNGMILNTGPTGSGKTTTLYAVLRSIATPEIKILTIEDPIEYHLDNISQTQTDADTGYTFLEGLRSALRQDPDVIMVGEIRDGETANTAINAAMTGHLVLSTLHTNTAAGAIPRLIDLGVNPKIIGSSLNATIGQRLLRKLCSACKVETPPDERERGIIQKVIDSLPQGYEVTLSTIAKPGSCDACNNTGYKGRVGIFEMVLMNEEIEQLITTNPSERELRKVAQKQGLLEMRQDGIIKVVGHVTSLEELRRVIDVEEEV